MDIIVLLLKCYSITTIQMNDIGLCRRIDGPCETGRLVGSEMGFQIRNVSFKFEYFEIRLVQSRLQGLGHTTCTHSVPSTL